mmetsp:Transcript_121917/g.221766  ORF Transcript_121917/g.221766 Transcript_121917/m.221766 type:complete len:678 (-) Transcript_121917:131-2164(-)
MGTFNVQKQIKDNATSVQEYFSDILKWTEEQGKVEKRRERKKKGEAPPHLAASFTPPPRGSALSPAVQASEASAGSDRKEAGDTAARTAESIARDKLPMPKYYHDWDQFDAEGEVEKIEDEEIASIQAEKKARQAERDRINDELAFQADGDRLRTSKAKPRVKINVRTSGRRAAPIDLAKPRKEEANKLFAAGRFREAMTTYSAALDYLEKYEPPSSEAKSENAESGGDCAGEETEALELKTTLLANRAAALLKLEEWREAIEDCEEALRFDPRHHKATLRRGFAFAKQKRWSLAARDLERAVVTDPGDKKAAAELQMARRNLGEQLKETHTHALAQMCDPTRAPTMPTRRLTVRVRRGSDGETATYGSAPSASAVAAPKPQGNTAADASVAVESTSSVTTVGNSDTAAVAGVASGSTSATSTPANSGARRPYVPRSVRVRGRTSAVPGSVADTSTPAASASGKNPAPAMSFYTFEAQWQRHRKKPKERGALLRKVGARALPKLLRESLDAEIVASIIAVLHSELHADGEGTAADAASFAAAVLDALSKTPRFEASLESLSAAELVVCDQVFTSLEARSEECFEDLAALREAFTPAPVLPAQEDLDEEEDEDDAPPPAEVYDEPTETPADMLKLQEMILPGDTLPGSGAEEDVQTSGGSPGAEPAEDAAEFSLDGCD